MRYVMSVDIANVRRTLYMLVVYSDSQLVRSIVRGENMTTSKTEASPPPTKEHNGYRLEIPKTKYDAWSLWYKETCIGHIPDLEALNALHHLTSGICGAACKCWTHGEGGPR